MTLALHKLTVSPISFVSLAAIEPVHPLFANPNLACAFGKLGLFKWMRWGTCRFITPFSYHSSFKYWETTFWAELKLKPNPNRNFPTNFPTFPQLGKQYSTLENNAIPKFNRIISLKLTLTQKLTLNEISPKKFPHLSPIGKAEFYPWK